jgi:hypothetical protein
MKIWTYLIGFSLLLLTACDPFELKPLDVKTVKGGNITVRWYQTSSISSVHNHVEIDKNGEWVKVMEADGNGYRIHDVLLNKDTVVIQAYKDMLVYQLTTEYWGTHVRLDTSISLHQYMKKFKPENAKYYTE